MVDNLTRILVSICMPVCNGSEFLSQAFESIAALDYPDLEIIISDDNSSDNTLKLCQEFAETSSIPVHVISHLQSGIGANWNNCIEHSKGKYIKFLFQDDLLAPSCISEMVQVMEAHPNMGIVASKRDLLIEGSPPFPLEFQRFIDHCDDLQKGLAFLSSDALMILNSKTLKHDSFFQAPQNKIGEPSVIMIRKAVLDKVGMYREDMHQILDYELYFRVIRISSIGIIRKTLASFRVHAKQASAANFGKSLDEQKQMERELYDKYWSYLGTKSRWRLWKKFHPFAIRVESIVYRLKSILTL